MEKPGATRAPDGILSVGLAADYVGYLIEAPRPGAVVPYEGERHFAVWHFSPMRSRGASGIGWSCTGADTSYVTHPGAVRPVAEGTMYLL